MDTMPVIHMELEGMKRTLYNALTQQALQLDTDINKAVESFCTQGNLAYVINNKVNAVLEVIIKEEVEKFYSKGEGRTIIAEAVKTHLLKDNK